MLHFEAKAKPKLCAASTCMVPFRAVWWGAWLCFVQENAYLCCCTVWSTPGPSLSSEADMLSCAFRRPRTNEAFDFLSPCFCSLIAEHGLQRWRHIASFMKGRTGKQVIESLCALSEYFATLHLLVLHVGKDGMLFFAYCILTRQTLHVGNSKHRSVKGGETSWIPT